jgi:DNA polymerase-3 subunit delta
MARGASYLFLGPELGEKQDAVAELKKKISPPPEESSFYAGETALTDVVAVLRNRSLFADTRLIFIKNAELIQKKDEVELLASYMASPREDTTLILISGATKLHRTLENAAGGKRIFYELFEDRKTAWVENFFRREGRGISPGAVEAVLEMVENNTDALRRECSRIMLFLGKKDPIGEEDVERCLSHTREESAFTLFSRIARGDLTRTVQAGRTLLGMKESPQAVLAGLSWCFRKLRDYLALTAPDRTGEVEFKKIGLASPAARRDYAAAAARYNAAAADRCLSLTAEYDVLLRAGGAGLDGLLLDRYLYKVILLGTD